MEKKNYRFCRMAGLQQKIPGDFPMVKKMILCSLLAMLLSACRCPCRSTATLSPEEKKAIAAAAEMIRSGEAECVLIRNGKQVPQKRGHGVSPLLALYDNDPAGMAGGIVVDKVIGRAAASIVICGKAKMVHGLIMSEDAALFLKANNVEYSCGEMVPRILNRDRSGLCPLEKSVEGIDDPAQALAALRAKIATFAK